MQARDREGATPTNAPKRGSIDKLVVTSGLLAAAWLAGASNAHACGGTFCDGGPQAMPVDQTGENILFTIADGMVEAHIQILYEGEAERFAWVIPLPAVPEQLRIGSTPLFTSLLNSTVPSYGYNTVCGGVAPAISGGGGQSEDRRDNANPLVVVEKQVGSFEVSILEGGSADEVIDWLGDNGYEQIPEAEPIIAQYVDQDHVFAAIKLTAGADVDEIHPIVVRYAGDTPCVPLKLTRVAALPDMGVRVFFLGDERYVPSNYRHVILNPVVIDWSNFASNYLEVVSRAVDSSVADGQAFVTEYAGATSIVQRAGIYSNSWSGDAFVNTTPSKLIQALEDQGLLSCSAARCTFNHPLLEPMLQKHLAPPAGVDAQAFYDCVDCFADTFDADAFDSTGFALEFMSRIVVPGRDASALLDRHPFLTRLFTTISPEEMTVDPTFHAHGNEPVSRTNLVSRARGDNYYSAAYRVTDDWVVELTADSAWPEFENIPYALSIEEYQPDGDKIELVDARDEIASALAMANAEQEFVSQRCREAIGLPFQGAAGANPDPDPPLLGSGGTATTGGSDGSGGTTPDEMRNVDRATGGGGCAFHTRGDRTLSWGGLLLAMVLGWRRQRREYDSAARAPYARQ